MCSEYDISIADFGSEWISCRAYLLATRNFG